MVVRTFKILVLGGNDFTTPEISIKVTCPRNLPPEYVLLYNFEISTGIDKTSISLPFLDVGATHACGVKKVELIGIENQDLVLFPAASCSDPVICNSVEIKHL